MLIAYLRPFVVNMLISQEGADKNYLSPSITSMGWAPYVTYVFVLTLFHHGYLVFPGMDEFRIFFVFYRKGDRHYRDQHAADLVDRDFIFQKREVQNKHGIMLAHPAYFFSLFYIASNKLALYLYPAISL